MGRESNIVGSQLALFQLRRQCLSPGAHNLEELAVHVATILSALLSALRQLADLETLRRTTNDRQQRIGYN
jgi:hypothetical protein